MGGWISKSPSQMRWDGTFEVKKAVTNTGTIEHIPTNAKDIVNKEYVDAQVSAVTPVDHIDSNDVSNVGTNTHAQVDTAITASTNHIADNTQAHSDYLKNDAVDVGVGLTLTGDNSSADTAYVPMILYNTDDTPPAASGFPIGTLYAQYTA